MVVTIDKIIEAQDLAIGTATQESEPIALELSQGKNVNIYTDSKYAFMVVHAHGTTWKERGLLTSGNEDIKRTEETLQLLEAVSLPNEITMMHCPGTQKDSSKQAGKPNCQKNSKTSSPRATACWSSNSPPGLVRI